MIEQLEEVLKKGINVESLNDVTHLKEVLDYLKEQGFTAYFLTDATTKLTDTKKIIHTPKIGYRQFIEYPSEPNKDRTEIEAKKQTGIFLYDGEKSNLEIQIETDEDPLNHNEKVKKLADSLPNIYLYEKQLTLYVPAELSLVKKTTMEYWEKISADISVILTTGHRNTSI